MFFALASESAIFVIFIVAYLFLRGRAQRSDRQRVDLPVLLTSAFLRAAGRSTARFAALSPGRGRFVRESWVATIVLGAVSSAARRSNGDTDRDEGLTIRTNLFGTTYYSLVGLHAFHVTVRPDCARNGRAA